MNSSGIEETSMLFVAVVAVAWPIGFGLYAFIKTKSTRNNALKAATDSFLGSIAGIK